MIYVEGYRDIMEVNTEEGIKWINRVVYEMDTLLQARYKGKVVKVEVCMCMHVCMYVCMYVCVYDMNTLLQARYKGKVVKVEVCVCMHVCMCVCVCVCMHICMHGIKWSK